MWVFTKKKWKLYSLSSLPCHHVFLYGLKYKRHLQDSSQIFLLKYLPSTCRWEIQRLPLCLFTIWFLNCFWHCWNPPTVRNFLFLTSLTEVSPWVHHFIFVSTPFFGFPSCSKCDFLSLTFSLITSYLIYFHNPSNSFVLAIHKFISLTLISYGRAMFCSLRIHGLSWHFPASFPLGRPYKYFWTLGWKFKWHISPPQESISKKLGFFKFSLPLTHEYWRTYLFSKCWRCILEFYQPKTLRHRQEKVLSLIYIGYAMWVRTKYLLC